MCKYRNGAVMGKLYLVATPIGNLEDMTFRAVKCLKEVDLIACEDTRHSKILLDHYEINTGTTSYHEHNKYEKAEELVVKMKQGMNVAVITDAGTPGISDPGEELVKQALAAGIEVTSLPGPSAVITALSMCGLSSRRFVFEGFLPPDKKERKEALARISGDTRTLVIYEAPHRIKKTLKELMDNLGDRNIRICRELTKKFEEVMAFSVSEAMEYFEANEPKGEMVVIIEGLSKEAALAEEAGRWEQMSISEHVDFYMRQGMSEKDAMKAAAKDRNISKRDVYDALKVQK
ncbi:MAG: 16S rRNA (cytidine(1402)-2'-O)-methyltransferase [Parasporobacterium sp.]|nr:16S rRNA (cytidine(1402)-2'-O)-methyltransferase [Parasporobacterium sp.]